jgi:hypothetical protein
MILKENLKENGYFNIHNLDMNKKGIRRLVVAQ